MIQPTYPLDPLMMNNAYPSRITATAGTRLVGINRKVQSLSSFPLGLYQINVSVLLGDWFSLSAIDQDSALLPILCSCGPFSFPLWLIVLSDQLQIIGLVSRYLTNYLIYSIGTSIGEINLFLPAQSAGLNTKNLHSRFLYLIFGIPPILWVAYLFITHPFAMSDHKWSAFNSHVSSPQIAFTRN